MHEITWNDDKTRAAIDGVEFVRKIPSERLTLTNALTLSYNEMVGLKAENDDLRQQVATLGADAEWREVVLTQLAEEQQINEKLWNRLEATQRSLDDEIAALNALERRLDEYQEVLRVRYERARYAPEAWFVGYADALGGALEELRAIR